MRNFREMMMRMMYGRYGTDQMYFGLLAIFIILAIVNLFIRSTVINIIDDLLLLYMIFRMMSRNIPKRQMENRRFMAAVRKINPSSTLTFKRMRDMRSYAYHRCPNCKAVLRFPRKAGRFPVTCPRCNKHFNIRNWF